MVHSGHGYRSARHKPRRVRDVQRIIVRRNRCNAGDATVEAVLTRVSVQHNLVAHGSAQRGRADHQVAARGRARSGRCCRVHLQPVLVHEAHTAPCAPLARRHLNHLRLLIGEHKGYKRNARLVAVRMVYVSRAGTKDRRALWRCDGIKHFVRGGRVTVKINPPIKQCGKLARVERAQHRRHFGHG